MLIINTPKPGDDVLVPDSDEKNCIVLKYVGGYATVNRVTEASPTLHFITVGEHTGYREYLWEGYLDKLQDTLREQYPNKQRAYIKSL
ncbi:MAG: hypothetical protein HC836_23140 [Richelia sp. RM2_1_2]|nr:hypothetical protein [Richelia sp. RM2_1_2]